MTSVPEADIRAALLRVTASEPFRNAPQLVSFLSFIVEKTLAGQSQAIKGYTIATQALGRSEDFDPQADPIVRVEAGRLRRALETYYALQGADDPIRIVVPRGTYVPQFRAVEPPAPAPAPEEVPAPAPPSDPAPPAPPGRSASEVTPDPSETRRSRDRQWTWLLATALVILALGLAGLLGLVLPAGPEEETDGYPLVGVGRLEVNGAPSAAFSPEVMRSMIIDGLARFDEITVIDLAEKRRAAAGERYVLNLRATFTPGAATVVSRLTHEPSGKVVWTRNFDPSRRPADVSAETEIARQIATSIAKPYGALFADFRNRPNVDPRARCIVQSYDYWSNPTPERHARARECLEQVVAAHPHPAVARANLAYFYLDEHRVGFNPRPNSLDRALQMARQAVELAPESPRANQALMAVLFAQGDTEQALTLGRRALELNPYDTDIMADLGARLVQTGRYGEGAALIRRAAAVNPTDPPWYHFFLFLAAYMQDDVQAARSAAARITAPDYVLGLIAKIVVAAYDRQLPQAQELIARMVRIQPEYARDPAAALAKRNFSPEIQARLLDALQRAGLRT